METTRKRIDPFNPPKPLRSLMLDPTDKRLAVLDLFTRYEVLPGAYIRHAAGVSTRLITDLNKAWYIAALPYSPKPSLLDARNREPVWIIGQRGKALLGKPVLGTGDHMKHKVGRTLCQYSFDVAADLPGVHLRTGADILAHENCPGPTKTSLDPFKVPLEYEGKFTDLVPDSELFGYEFNGKFFYLFFEYDNGTETRMPGTFRARKKKNIQRMIRQYNQVITDGSLRARFGISNIFIGIVADSELHEKSIRRVIEQEVSQKNQRFFGTKHLGDKFPEPGPHMVTEDWWQVGDQPLNILTTLGAPHELRKEAGASKRVA